MPPVRSAIHADLENARYREWLRFLQDAETWDRERVELHQLQRLQNVVRHAYDHTSAYRRLFNGAGLEPEELRTLNDFRRLPFVTKEAIRDALEEYSAPWPERQYVTTGGSTGIPFGFYRDQLAFARELASKAHQYHRVGWREGDRQLVFRGSRSPLRNISSMCLNSRNCAAHPIT